MGRSTRQGFPAATTPAGRLRFTTDPAATMVPAPMVTPGSTVTLPPIQTSSAMVMGAPNSSSVFRTPASMGCPAAKRLTLGPKNTWEPMATDATSRMMQS